MQDAASLRNHFCSCSYLLSMPGWLTGYFARFEKISHGIKPLDACWHIDRHACRDCISPGFCEPECSWFYFILFMWHNLWWHFAIFRPPTLRHDIHAFVFFLNFSGFATICLIRCPNSKSSPDNKPMLPYPYSTKIPISFIIVLFLVIAQNFYNFNFPSTVLYLTIVSSL